MDERREDEDTCYDAVVIAKHWSRAWLVIYLLENMLMEIITGGE